LKEITLPVAEALSRWPELTADHLREGFYLYRAEAGEQVFFAEIEDRLQQLDGETRVTLVFFSESELLAATLAEARGFLDRWVQRLPGIADRFYGGQGSPDMLVQLAETLEYLQALSVQLSARGYGLDGWPERLRDAARELLQVAEANQAVQQGDFLLYELQGALEGLSDRLARIEVAVPIGRQADGGQQ
jgi:hypothetical protein